MTERTGGNRFGAPAKVFLSAGVNNKAMRQYPYLLLVLAVLISAGCVEEYDPNATVTMTPAPVPVTTAVVLTNTPVQTPTPAPEQMAYLANIKCGTGDIWGKDYHCNGDVRIRSGAARQVQVISRYPDNNTFASGIADLGGSDAIAKPFVIFPDLKYQGQNPDYFVRVDKTLYPVTWSGSMGTAWSNTPGAEGITVK
jgi:hypothetical protein